ncbi:ATP-binding protein [Sphaerisporangium sp. NPDC088356]|uniref:ATP-binding protein n=1 Tax=Sphaerisporangium sp. NPDC088356 TaxID=3154871 RepID=UPI0034305CA7
MTIRTTEFFDQPREGCWDLPGGPESIGKARRVVQEALIQWGAYDLVDDVTLVVTELLTNAVLHARPPITLTLRLNGNVLTGAVTDHGDIWPNGDGPGCPEDDEHGRGLQIVAALTDRWGVDPGPGSGKTVWFGRLIQTPSTPIPNS